MRVYHGASSSADSEADNSLDEILRDGHTKNPADSAGESDELHHVLRLLNKLDQRQAAVLRMRFGLGEGEPMTLKEVGHRLGLTRERVRQIEGEALSKLREEMEAV